MTGSKHRAVPVLYPGAAVPECRTCGLRVVVLPGQTPVHAGEALPVVYPEPEDARAFSRAVDAATSAVAALPAGAPADDVARAATEAIYRAGHLRRRPAPPPRPRDEQESTAAAAAAVRRRYEAPEPRTPRVLTRVG